MIKFEKVSRLAAADFNLPVRKTKSSAGYDFEVAEDIIVPTWTSQLLAIAKATPQPKEPYSLAEIAQITKSIKAKPSLVSTGVKCYLEPGYYLELSVRSSTPLKHWVILANGVGIIDADYADNEDNEGEIFFQLINLSPFDIYLKKGDIIGQGIIKRYEVTDDDKAEGERTGGFGSTSGNEVLNTVDQTDYSKLLQKFWYNDAAPEAHYGKGTRSTCGIIDEAINIELGDTIQKACKDGLEQLKNNLIKEAQLYE